MSYAKENEDYGEKRNEKAQSPSSALLRSRSLVNAPYYLLYKLNGLRSCVQLYGTRLFRAVFLRRKRRAEAV